MRPEELDELDAIHRDATSGPWDGEWEIVEEPDEHGYYPQREVRAEKDGMHLATFAYLQHLELFLAALRLPTLTREIRLLLDVVDAAPRNLACHALPEKVALPPDVEDCGECEACRFNAALARLDGTEAP